MIHPPAKTVVPTCRSFWGAVGGGMIGDALRFLGRTSRAASAEVGRAVVCGLIGVETASVGVFPECVIIGSSADHVSTV